MLLQERQILLQEKQIDELKSCCRQLEKRLNEAVFTPPEWEDGVEISRKYNISQKTLKRYWEDGVLPHSIMGGRTYYRSADIDNYHNQHMEWKGGKS